MKFCFSPLFVIDSDKEPWRREGLRIAMLGGPGSGKCVSGDTLVFLSDGRYLPIKEVVENKMSKVFSLMDNHRIKKEDVAYHWQLETDCLLNIVTATGRRIKVTRRHPLLTRDGWAPAETIREGQHIAVPLHLPLPGKTPMEVCRIKILAYIIAEGHIRKSEVLFTNTDEKIKHDFAESVSNFHSNMTVKAVGKDTYRVIQKKRKRYNTIYRWLEQLGLSGKKAADKFIPQDIFQLPKVQLALFLNRLFSCDGSIYIRTLKPGLYGPRRLLTIEYSSNSEILIRQLQHLLLRFGILSYIKYREEINNWRLYFHRKRDFATFIQEIGFFRQKQKIASDISLHYPKSSKRHFRITETWRVKNAKRVFWDEVKEITKITGKTKVYDLAIKKHHNFIANDFFVHNSWNNSVIAEQFLSQGGTVVIFQPRDEYYTLKEKFDILSVGGVHAKDMEFALTSPSIYAKAVVEDGVSMIFYTSAAEDEEKLIGWVSRFIKYLLKYQEEHRRPLLLILEEAQEYAPRSASGHVAPPWVYNRMIKAFKDCFTQGRKLNIIAIASSQRPQELNFTVRQLANLTFFGKFSDQDIGYVDKECLKYVRKQGIEVDASRLVTLGLGEWLVIMGKKTGFVKVTHKRLTKHGAETPRLEYVAPRTTKAKKSIDQLSKAVMEALSKEEREKSELEKAKRKIRDLEKKLEAAEEQAKIKLNLKELLESAGSEPAKVAEKITALETEKVDLEKKLEVLQSKFDLLVKDHEITEKRVEELEQDLELFQQLKDILGKIVGFEPTPPRFEPGSQQIGLQAAMTIVDVPAKIKSVTISDDTVAGKILTVAKKGFLDKWVRLGVIVKAIVEEGWTVSSQAVNAALKDLVKQGLIAKKHTDRNYFMLAKNVQLKKEG